MLLFLGSGISFPSELPSVMQITERILKDTYYRDLNTTGTYYSTEHEDLQHVETICKVQQLLQLLNELDGHYLQSIAPYESGGQFHHTGSIYRTTTTYEDLFYLTEQIISSGVGLLDDALAGAFVDLVERKAGNLLEGENSDARVISLYHLAREASRFIEWMVARSLHTERIVGLDLVVELAKSQWIERLNIVTLNHDTLIEQVLSENNIRFVDGFGSQDGDVRWYDDTVYDDKDARVRLIKLHGSVNWYSFSVNGKVYPAIVVGRDPMQSNNEKGERLKNHLQTPSFLSGANKVISYNKGIYADVFYRFHQVLRENDLMVMSGYGWGDTAINFRLENWMDYNSHNTIILLHENPKKLTNRSLQLDESYNARVKVGQLVPVPQWLCNTSLSNLTSQSREGKGRGCADAASLLARARFRSFGE